MIILTKIKEVYYSGTMYWYAQNYLILKFRTEMEIQ